MKTLALLLFACAVSVWGQTVAAPIPVANQQFLDCRTGVCLPLNGGKLFSYTAGTLTPKVTYTDSTGVTANANPVVLNSSGFNAAGSGNSGVWIKGACYKFILKDAFNVVLWTQDNVCNQEGLLAVTFAGSTGAASIGYTYPNGTTRTVYSRLTDSISVKDFGATGNGSTDDTAAITSAVTATGIVNGTLIFPCGTYLFSSEITITTRITIAGGGDGDAGASSKACTTLKKTSDVIGIHISSGADYTVLRNFYLTSTAGSGTSDGIAIGDADATNGAGGVVLDNVFVANHKGNGINVRNGNSGVMNHVTANANGINGILISSQQTSSNNTNAWALYSPAAFSNTQDGISLDNAATSHVLGADSEGNLRYGVYCNASAMWIEAHIEESGGVKSFFSTASCFGSHVEVSDPFSNMTCGSRLMYCVNLQAAKAPYASPDGRFGTTGGFGTPVVNPTYGASVTINNDLGNTFYITATNSTPFTVAAPSGTGRSSRITVTIKNSSGGTLGAVTWTGYVMNSVWVNPGNGFSRSVDFQLDESTLVWTEVGRTLSDVGSANVKTDFAYSSTAPFSATGQTASGSNTAFSYPNIPVQSVWQTSCHIYTTTAGAAGTATLFLQPRNVAGTSQASGTLSLTSAASTITVTDFEVIPANTAARSIGVAWFVTGNSGGVFTAECVSLRIQ